MDHTPSNAPTSRTSWTRRGLLGTLTAAAFLAGCSSTDETGTTNEVDVLRDELYCEDVTGVRGILENVSNRKLDYVEALVKFYDDDGSRLAAGLASTNDFPTDRKWRFDVLYTGSAAATAVARYELETHTSLGFTHQ